MKLIARVPKADLASGAMVRVTYPPFDVLVSEVDGAYAAIEDNCNHAGASLSEGERLDRGRVSCPMHGYVFDLTTGELLAPKGLCDHQRRFRTSVEGDDVLVWEPPSLMLMT